MPDQGGPFTLGGVERVDAVGGVSHVGGAGDVERPEVDAPAPASHVTVWGRLRTPQDDVQPLLLVRGPGRTLRLGSIDAPPTGRTANGECDPEYRATFAVPIELAEDPDAAFGLVLPGGEVQALPRPSVRAVPASSEPATVAATGAPESDRFPWVARVAIGLAIPTIIVFGYLLLRGAFETAPGGAVSRDRAGLAAPVQTTAPGPTTVARPQPGILVGDTVTLPVGTSLVARALHRRVNVYPSPTARQRRLLLSSPDAQGAQLTFLAQAKGSATLVHNRLLVWLPTRPNQSSGWISRRDVTLELDPYGLHVDLRRHRLYIWRMGRLIESDPIGVGRALTPTPGGLYYITELLRQSDLSSIYGPYAFGLSAHSTVLNEFAGGNGRIGLHGTNEPSLVGSNVSHGCIRMRNATITHLAHLLPLGTPVRIIH